VNPAVNAEAMLVLAHMELRLHRTLAKARKALGKRCAGEKTR
jgi:hypothetical protein